MIDLYSWAEQWEQIDARNARLATIYAASSIIIVFVSLYSYYLWLSSHNFAF